MLDNIILGGIEDQIGALILGWKKSYTIPELGAPFGTIFSSPLHTNEPIFAFIYNSFVQKVNSVVASNVFAIVSIFLLLFVSYKLFKFFNISSFLSLVLSFIFSFSPYVFLHIGIHPQLSQIWLVPAFFLIFLFGLKNIAEKSNVVRAIVSGCFLSFSILISNYLGYFLLLSSACILLSIILINAFIIKQKFSSLFFPYAKYYSLVYLTFALITLPLMYTYIKAVYFGPGKVSQDLSTYTQSSRTLEDFQNFSARPWYYILPPTSNPWLGETITQPILDFLKNDWGYFLADDYFPKEHGADFLGWLNIIVFISALIYVLRQISKRTQFYSKYEFRLILGAAFTAFLLFLFTMPPFITISGLTIYTPGMLLYKLFPMFRVTARLGVFILLLVLIVNGLFLNKFKRTKYFMIYIFLYLVLTLIEFRISISTMDVSKVPAVYRYIQNIPRRPISVSFTGPNGVSGVYTGPLIIAEYPNDRSEDIYWITRYEAGLINPRMYYNTKFDFNGDSFTKNLATPTGLQEASRYGVSYIVFHKDRIPKSTELRESELKNKDSETFFRDNLITEKDFGNIILYRFK